jgi:glycosyltransferase involved in cell wall biosynthesis
MTILVVSDADLQGKASGVERVLAAHCLGLAKRGHTVYLIAGVDQAERKTVEDVQGVRVYRYRRSPAPCLGAYRAFRALSARISFQVVIFHQPLSALGILLSRGSRAIPRAYVFHSPWAREYGARTARRSMFIRGGMLLRRSMERLVLKRCQRIFVLSRFMADRLSKDHAGLGDRVAVLPGGVDLDRFKPAQDREALRAALGVAGRRSLLLTVRNLEPRMGLDNLLLAIQEVSREVGDFTLLIGGEGPMERELKGLAQRLGLGSLVRFEGYIPEERLPVYYQAGDFFVLPSKELEGFGLVAVEALACGTPVLGTPVGAIPELAEGLEKDLLFWGTDPGAIARGIRSHLGRKEADPHGYRILRQRCRAFVEARFGWDAIVERLERQLFNLVGQR